jgi:hypothetical protein
MHDCCKSVLLLYVVTTLVYLPDDDNCAEIGRSILIPNYIIYRIFYLLVLMVFIKDV